MMRALCLSLVSLAAAGCSHSRELERGEIEAIAQRHDDELAAFHHEQLEFARRNPVPQQLDFPSDGTILIHECALAGYPGRAELRLQYTYVNTTGRTIDGAHVTIALRDPTRDVEWSQAMDLELPLSFRFSPGSSYTTHVELPTHDVQLQPGWTWRIRPEAFVRAAAQDGGV